MRTIIIENEKYHINSTAKSLFDYRKNFKCGLLEDQQIVVNTLTNSIGEINLEDEKKIQEKLLNDVKGLEITIQKLLQIVYVLIIESERPLTFDEFLENIQKVDITEEWISLVLKELSENFTI